MGEVMGSQEDGLFSFKSQLFTCPKVSLGLSVCDCLETVLFCCVLSCEQSTSPGGCCAVLKSVCSHAQSSPGGRAAAQAGALLFLCDWHLDFLLDISHVGDFLGRNQ